MVGYEVAAGSIQGRDHRDSGKSNQDGYYIFRDEQRIIATICDGCSDGRKSEVGASLVSRLLVTSILRHWDIVRVENSLVRNKGWRRVEQDVLAKLRSIALDLGGSFSEVVSNYLLCTIIGCVVTKERIIQFSLGDGVWVEGGTIRILPPFQENSPPYLGYRLFDSLPKGFFDSQLHLSVTASENVESRFPLAFGSDGVESIIRAEGESMPGQMGIVGPLSQFWEDDTFFQNADKLRRKLVLLNREVISMSADGSVQRERGKCLDDTTLIVIRKGKQEGE